MWPWRWSDPTPPPGGRPPASWRGRLRCATVGPCRSAGGPLARRIVVLTLRAVLRFERAGWRLAACRTEVFSGVATSGILPAIGKLAGRRAGVEAILANLRGL